MYNQAQGTYPQLAGSFYNTQPGLMPHDNGRTAQQVPTFFGGLQNMMSASSAMSNYQNIPLGQSILGSQAAAGDAFNRGLTSTLSGIGTGLSVGTGIAGLGAMFSGSGLLRMVGGPLGMGAALMGGTIVSGYNKRMRDIEDMRSAMSGSRLGFGVTNAYTGQLTNTAALDLSDRLKSSASGAGFSNSDLKQVMGSASGLGMLNGMGSLSEVTKKITDLAKVSRDIVMLGEGISMQDAMHLQKLTQDMGISTAKFKGMGIGKNLVAAARAAGMTMDQAAQMGGQGAMTFQQMGFGAAAGINSAFYNNRAAQALSTTGNISQRELAAFGGVQGLGQNLMMGQAGTMSRFGDAMIMGAVKLDRSGELRMDRELLDRFVRGDVSTKDLINRGKNLGSDLSKRDRNRLMEQIRFSMPQLRESVGDMLNTEEMMTVQGRAINELSRSTGMSTRMAANQYFQDSNQAEAFLKYAQNYGSIRAEGRRQERITQQEERLRYAGMAKSSTALARLGRGIGKGIDEFGDFVSGGMSIGKRLAEAQAAYADNVNRGASAMFAHDLDLTSGLGNLTRGDLRGVPLSGGLTRPNFSNLLERVGVKGYEQLVGSQSQYEFGGTGLESRLRDVFHGDRNFVESFLEGVGFNTSPFSGVTLERSLQDQAYFTDQVYEMSDIASRSSEYRRDKHGGRFREFVNKLRVKGRAIEAGGAGSDQLQEILPAYMLGQGATQDDKISLAKAYEYIRSSEADPKVRAGISRAEQKLQAVANLRMNVTKRKSDILELSGGGKLEAKGLSEALHLSGIQGSDLNKLVNYLSTETGSNLIQDSASAPSASYILSEAGVNIKGMRAGQASNLIKVLMQGQVTTGDRTVDLLGSVLGGAAGLKIRGGDLRDAKGAYRNEQLNRLDAAIGQALGDTAAKGFRGDMLGLMLTGDDREALALKELMKRENASNALFRMTSESLEGDDELIATANTSMEDVRKRSIAAGLIGKAQIEASNKHRERRAIAVASLDAKGYDFDSQGKVTSGSKNRVRRSTYEKHVADYRANSKDRLAALAKETGGRQVFNQEGKGFSSLTDVLMEMAKNDPEKLKAYTAFTESKGFAELEVGYRQLKAQVGAGAKTQSDAQNILLKKVTDAILKSDQKNILGKKESDGLPAVLKLINTGLETFNKHLQRLGSTGQSIELKLNPKK